ncbi:MAG TPA: chemotaxis protein CheB, partial [Reyranella sp.]
MTTKGSRRDEPEPSRNGAAIPIVGIGASAGGIGALETLVPLLEPGAGLAYVVVQHLDPDRKSVLATLLARTAKIPVIEIADHATIETDHVYVIPPNAALAIFDNRLQISAPLEQRFQRTPIDGFFISLAEANGEGAAGVILSGTGSDGTLGLRAIKEQGGLTVAQDGAEYDGMMRSAVRSGVVDFVLPLDKIPAKLNDYFRHLTSVDGRKGPDGVRPEAADHLAQICALLRTRTGHDFSGYKDQTMARRVQR